MLRKTIAALALAPILVMSPAQADHQHDPNFRPTPDRHSCVDAHWKARSQVARDCRRSGWVVRPRVVINPRDKVRFNWLRECRFPKQQRACYWEGRGRDFVRVPTPGGFRTFFVR